MASALINVPPKAKRGDIIEIKTLISHIMETGFRRTAAGEIVPRDIITSFACRYNGKEIFRADLFPAISANPFISFFTIAKESGKLEFEWIGDNGFASTARRRSRSNDFFRAIAAVALLAATPSLLAANSARTSAAPAIPSWDRTARRCRTTTPPIPACSSCSTARRSGTRSSATPARPAPTAMATRARSMKGVAARYPAFDKALGRPVTSSSASICAGAAPRSPAASL